MTGPAQGGPVPPSEAAAALERRYRRLLSWYPRGHRSDYAEEMLGVLMAGADPGQRRPRVRESADLLRGAVWVRMRRAVGWFAAPGWRDTLAMMSLLAPALGLTVAINSLPPAWLALGFSGPLSGFMARSWLVSVAGPLLLAAEWVIALLAVVLRKRLVALGAAAMGFATAVLMGILWGMGLAGQQVSLVAVPAQICLAVLTLVCVPGVDGLGSRGGPGGRAAIQHGRSVWLLIVGLPLLAALHATVGLLEATGGMGALRRLEMVAIAAHMLTGVPVIAVLAAAAAAAPAGWLRTPAGRRALALAGPAVDPRLLFYLAERLTGQVDFSSGPSGVGLAVVWAVYLALATLVAALAVTARWFPGGAGSAAAVPGGGGTGLTV